MVKAMSVSEALKRADGAVWLPAHEEELTDLSSDDVVVREDEWGRRWATLKKYDEAENATAKNVLRLVEAKGQPTVPRAEIVSHVADYERANYPLHERQRKAVEMIVNNNVSVLTGGPGTGKTTVMKAAVYVLDKIFGKPNIRYCAPTGKAAMRLSESVGEQAVTIHRKLGVSYDLDKAHEVSCDILVIDEFSMCDIELAEALFKSIRTGTKIVVLGDTDQLPSVGPGAVLRDFLQAVLIPQTKLTHTFRQAGGSPLLTNIHGMQAGKNHFEEGDDFKMVELPDDDVPEGIVDMYVMEEYDRLVEKYGRDQVAVLLPYHNAGYGSSRVNSLLKATQGLPESGVVKTDGTPLSVGDLVMQQENRKECVNGEVGKITRIEDGVVYAEYTKGEVGYTESELDQIELAYAMSITKSQGSEYKGVIVVTLNSHICGLTRNSLYTGISRAKKECVMLYQKSALDACLKTRADGRKTFLVEKMQTELRRYRQCEASKA